MSRVYIFLADGFEDIEGLTVVDLMRRAGIEAVTVSIQGMLSELSILQRWINHMVIVVKLLHNVVSIRTKRT